MAMDAQIATWRRQQRAVLLAKREAISSETRQQAAQYVAARLNEYIAASGCSSIGLYWPIKHEINLRSWAQDLAHGNKVVLCLPVVVARKAPLEYWRWQHGEKLARGIWDIPVPARRDVVIPDLMLAPLVGFDRANYRLGYGGGYFDRTLTALSPPPMVIGVGYAFSALDSIFPQPHDIPMDAVVTDQHSTLPQHGGNHGTGS
jgi:5,10-methenyltetrahydrofolate synthetase